jgi:hypothetical protein
MYYFLRSCALFCLSVVWASATTQLSAAESPNQHTEPAERAFLPDFSQGYTGRLGPFWWGRSLDFGEDLFFADATGRPAQDGTYLWSHQFNRSPPKQPDQRAERGLNALGLHGRNNLIAVDPNIAWQIQTDTMWLHAPGSHNAKISLGYMPQDFRYQHGENTDLEHLADAPRVVLFIPIRHNHGAVGTDLDAPYLSTIYAAQSISVLEFAPQEIIQYEWFRNPKNLHPRILCDLVPHLGEEPVYVNLSKPLFRFDLTDQAGGWRVRIELDGRDGLAGGRNAEGWDIDVSAGQPGATPYSIDLDPNTAAWSMSLFSPGGRPAGTSQFLLGLQPYHRSTDEDVPWPARTPVQRSLPVSTAQVK